jgi:hypothetical protein
VAYIHGGPDGDAKGSTYFFLAKKKQQTFASLAPRSAKLRAKLSKVLGLTQIQQRSLRLFRFDCQPWLRGYRWQLLCSVGAPFVPATLGGAGDCAHPVSRAQRLGMQTYAGALVRRGEAVA